MRKEPRRGPSPVTREESVTVDSTLEQRIDRMLRRDIRVGVTFAIVMWVTLIFVLVVTLRVVDDSTVAVVMAAAAIVLGLFNTASLMSMISRYRHERQHVYGEDIAHLDAQRALRRSAPEASAR